MASAAVHQCRFFFAGRMAPEVGDARMTTDAAKIAVSGLRECDAEFVTIMASLALADENVRLGSGRGAPCERDPCGAEKTEKRNVVDVKSPMVGTFYRAASPEAPAYVNIGDTIDVGQVVCIIEAMKLMNEIKSEVKGKVVDIQVDNAEPVEFGQVLFVVEPS